MVFNLISLANVHRVKSFMHKIQGNVKWIEIIVDINEKLYVWVMNEIIYDMK